MDKLLHFLFSIAIGLFGALLTLMPPDMAAMTLVAGVAVAKEIYDYMTGKGTPEFSDIIYGILGGMVSLVIIESIKWLTM